MNLAAEARLRALARLAWQGCQTTARKEIRDGHRTQIIENSTTAMGRIARGCLDFRKYRKASREVSEAWRGTGAGVRPQRLGIAFEDFVRPSGHCVRPSSSWDVYYTIMLFDDPDACREQHHATPAADKLAIARAQGSEAQGPKGVHISCEFGRCDL
jgi:hypothetical protein